MFWVGVPAAPWRSFDARGPVVRRRRAHSGLFLAALVIGQEVRHLQATVDSFGSSKSSKAPVVEDEPQETSAAHFSSPSRRLEVPVGDNWQWPDDTNLQFTFTPLDFENGGVAGEPVTTVNPDGATEVVVLASGCGASQASVRYQKVQIISPGTTWGTPHDTALIKLVSRDYRYQCWTNEYDVPVGAATRDSNLSIGIQPGEMGLSSGPLQLDGDGDEIKAFSNIVFMWGGEYHLCYTPETRFSSNTKGRDNIVPISIRVLGVKSPCDQRPSDGCIEKERWECFFGYLGDGSYQTCELNFKVDGRRPGWSVTEGDKSKITWSKRYGDDSPLATDFTLPNAESMHPEYCGVGAPDTENVFEAGAEDMLEATNLVAATLPAVRSSHSEAFSIAACYCPSWDVRDGSHCVTGQGQTSNADNCCDQHAEYIQMVGTIYYWTIRICDMDNYEGRRTGGSTAGCAQPYRRVLPQQHFVIRVECPPGGGCEGNENNVIRFINVGTTNNRPSWWDQHPCKTTQEPINIVVWPDDSLSETQNGGKRVDYKAWHLNPVKINKSVKQSMDVCFSNTNSPAVFFKVGRVTTASAFAFASHYPGHWDASNDVNVSTVKYANFEGSFTLYGGITSGSDSNPFDSNPYSGKAKAYFISYDRDADWGQGASQTTLQKHLGFDRTMPIDAQTSLDAQCQRARPSPSLVVGTSDNFLPLAEVQGAAYKNERFHTFSGSSQRDFITVAKSGVIAICYCGMLSDSGACEPANWIYAGRMTILGPVGTKTWTFNTEVVVKIEVEGWGLSADDRLRIIPNSGDCTERSGNPVGDTTFKLGCPAQGGAGCGFASENTMVPLNALTGPGVGNTITISSIVIETDYSHLIFSESVKDLLFPGDVITIDYDGIQIGDNNPPKDRTTQTPQERYDIYQLSGEWDYQDTLDGVIDKYMLGHTLSYPDDVNGVVDEKTMRIPLGWQANSRPDFKFPNAFDKQGGRWKRRNKVSSDEEIKGMTATPAPLKVCWGVEKVGVTKFYQQAGLIEFIDPPPMAQAKVFLTTKTKSAIAPSVIFFRTDPQRTQYASTTGMTKLMLRFLDTSDTNGKLQPFYATDQTYNCPQSGCPEALPPNDEFGMADAEQYLCGKLFSEMWSEDSEGFPIPKGCYFSKKYLDNPGTDNTFYREVTVLFRANAGLRPNTKYMLVMNTKVPTTLDPSAGDIPLVDIFTMCAEDTGCERPYMVFEKSTAHANREVVEPGSETAEPRFRNGGFQVQAPNPEGVLNLSEMNILQIKLTAGDGMNAIKPRAIIRMYMWPLTQWNVGSAPCIAQCIAYHATSAATCNGAVGCDPSAVVDPSYHTGYNIIKLTLPSAMTDITESTSHTIKVNSLTLPQGGFFPSRIGVQLTKDDDTSPQYTVSNGLIWKFPEAGRTEGRLVLSDRTGYGPLPFAGDEGNTLVVRLKFGATLWNWGSPSETEALVEIQLPNGYSCDVQGQGHPEDYLDVFNVDANSDDFPDNHRGLLNAAPRDGGWDNSREKRCYYDLRGYNRIYEGQVAYVKLTVTNPGDPFQKRDLANVWSIQLSSRGANYNYDPQSPPPAPSMPYVEFTNNSQIDSVPGGSQYFSGNAAVLKELEKPLFQPAADPNSFTWSCCGAGFDQRTTQQNMRVFFKPGVTVGQRGYVVIDAPDGFDFGDDCSVSDLDPLYYAFVGEGQDLVRRLKPPLTCLGERYPFLTATTYNRASIRVAGLIDSREREYYGFQILVTHPSSYDTTQQTEWRLWTEDASGFTLEGSKTSVQFNPSQASTMTQFYDQSWGLYRDQITHVNFELDQNQPSALNSGEDTMISVYPIIFTESTQTSLRITAPLGFRWGTDTSEFVFTTNCLPGDLCEPFGGPPDGVLPTAVENVLYWPSIYFNPNVRYGFRHKIRVPEHNPRISANSFFLEFGYDKTDIAERLRAGVFEAPRVAALINCKVGYNSNQVGLTDNRMQFNFQTMTEVDLDAGIIIVGDQNARGFRFDVEGFQMVDDSDPLPSDVVVTAPVQPDNTPRIFFKTTANPIPPGYYKIEFKVSNPDSRIINRGDWTFGSYREVQSYDREKPLDAEMIAPGFTINTRMAHAGLFPLNAQQQIFTGREDRPGYINNLVFNFEVKSKPADEEVMLLKAPRGFIFMDDCLGDFSNPQLKTDRNTVFGDNTGGVWPEGDLEPWPPNFAPTKCQGDGRDAYITIPQGLEQIRRYAFRIRVQNPTETPEWNKWTITYNRESSNPFPGFAIWTSVTKPTSEAVSYAKNQGGSADPMVNPVTLTFSPFKTVPGRPTGGVRGGVVRVEAPSGFLFVHNNNECEVDLRPTGAANPTPPRDLLCEVDSSLTSMNIILVGDSTISGEDYGSGFEYKLIVFVNNPNSPQEPGIWHVNTFSRHTREPEFSLDETKIDGFAIHQDLWRFSVTNVLQEFNGKRLVNEVEIILNFRDHVKDGHRVTVFAPRGFDIVGNPELDSCDNYAPVGSPQDWFPAHGPPKCKCDNTLSADPLEIKCRLYWGPLREGRDPAFAQRQNLHFKISTVNPSKTPFITDNYWKAEHRQENDVLMASQIARSWDINPQLDNVQINFIGRYRSAGSVADLNFIFTPVNDACCIEIQAEFPTEFDFTQSTVLTSYDILQQEGSRIVINLRSPGLQSNEEISLKVYSVRLGRGGGETRFNLITYFDDELEYKRDEALQFTGGFRLPGRVTVLDKGLTSTWKESRLQYPVKSLFQPRVEEWAKAEFRLSFSQTVYAQGDLLITCMGPAGSQGYTMKTDAFMIIGTGQIRATVVLTDDGAIKATLKPTRPATEPALQAFTPYSVTFQVYPDNDGENLWRFDTTDAMQGYTNTNDGETAGFNPVQNFKLTVNVERSPPQAVIEVLLNVDPGNAVVRELKIIAPPGFLFDEGPDGCGDMCMPGQALGSTGRRTATLASPTGQALSRFNGLRIRVRTPEQTPIGTGSEGIMWFVEGRGLGVGQEAATTKGWGQGSGFAISQMNQALAYYAGIANLRSTQLAFTFALEVDAGSTIFVLPPAGFILTCSLEGSLKTISLPGERPNCIDDPLQLQLAQPLTRGTYSFAVTVDLPPETPSVNTFNIVIQDQYNNVVDAAYGVPGEELVDLGAEKPTLSWSRAEPGQPSIITVGITFTRDTPGLQALLIQLPELFQHDVQIPIDVLNLNSRFPLAPGNDWADTTEPDRIKIFLDDSEDVTTIPAGVYQFQFPVLVPPDTPRKNLWFVALCDNRACQQISDRSVKVSFPVAGFRLYELAAEGLKTAAAFAPRQHANLSLVWVLAALLAWCFSSSSFLS